MKPSDASLPDIDDVKPRSEMDDPCLKELRSVLAKHGALGRFGITLLHDHFPIADDEVLMEECDATQRTLTLRPVKVSEVEGTNSVETSWRLDIDGAIAVCRQLCVKGSNNKHAKKHVNFS